MDIDLRRAQSLYESGLSGRMVAAELGVPRTTLRRALKRAGFTFRDGSAAAKTAFAAGRTRRTLSRETRQKLSEGRMGKKHSAASRQKMSKAHMGRRPSEATRQKLSTAREGNQNSLGHRQTAEHRQKLSEANSGAKNPSWRGGISFEPYSPEFNGALKREVRKQAGYQCQACGVTQAELSEALGVHHMDGDKQNSDLANLQALCRSCHSCRGSLARC